MPYTTYHTDFVKRDMREVDLKASGGTTYYWHPKDKAVFPFGFGLSYSKFEFKWSNKPPAKLAIPSTLATANSRSFTTNHTVTVTNVGDRVSDIVALAFVVAVPGASPPDMPLRKLFGFERFHAMAPKESRTAYFESTAESLGVVVESGAKKLLPGKYSIEIGSVSLKDDPAENNNQQTHSKAVSEIELVGAELTTEENLWIQELARKSKGKRMLKRRMMGKPTVAQVKQMKQID